MFTNPLVAIVKDTAGKSLQGATVTFAAPGSGASVTFPGGTTAITNAQGLASVTVKANGTAGSFTVTATVAGVATPANFALTSATTLTAPAFTSATAAAFTVGTAGTFTVTARVRPHRPYRERRPAERLSFNTKTGVLSGTPTGGPGTFP